MGLGLEGVCVEEPAAEGNLDAELVFLVAFALERHIAVAAGLGVGERRPGDTGERRRLVEVAVEAVEDPVEFGNL